MKLLLLIFLLVSCSHKDKNYKRRNFSEYNSQSMVTQYFLPDLPAWANFSRTANCQRSTSIRFMEMKKLRGSYAFNYEQALQFQYMYNILEMQVKREASVDYLPFKEEEQLFFEAADKIEAGIRNFMVPKHKRVHLIWVDPAKQKSSYYKRLVSELTSGEMSKGYPVFMSLCMNYFEMSNFISKKGFKDFAIKSISQEMFSPYDLANERKPGAFIYLEKIFKEKDLYLFIPKGMKEPEEFIGDINVRTY